MSSGSYLSSVLAVNEIALDKYDECLSEIILLTERKFFDGAPSTLLRSAAEPFHKETDKVICNVLVNAIPYADRVCWRVLYSTKS